jgi:hypothetical protein
VGKSWCRLEKTEKIEMDMIDKLASKHRAEKVVIGSNDSILLTTLTEHPTLRPIYLRITYKRIGMNGLNPILSLKSCGKLATL